MANKFDLVAIGTGSAASVAAYACKAAAGRRRGQASFQGTFTDPVPENCRTSTGLRLRTSGAIDTDMIVHGGGGGVPDIDDLNLAAAGIEFDQIRSPGQCISPDAACEGNVAAASLLKTMICAHPTHRSNIPYMS